MHEQEWQEHYYRFLIHAVFCSLLTKIFQRIAKFVPFAQVTIEEFTMESERSQGKVLFTKLTIQQRMSDDTYLGELYTDRDYIQGHPPKGTMCK